MESFGQNNSNLTNLKTEKSPDVDLTFDQDSLPLCAYCGFEEKFLGNQFVKVGRLFNLMISEFLMNFVFLLKC